MASHARGLRTKVIPAETVAGVAPVIGGSHAYAFYRSVFIDMFHLEHIRS